MSRSLFFFPRCLHRLESLALLRGLSCSGDGGVKPLTAPGSGLQRGKNTTMIRIHRVVCDGSLVGKIAWHSNDPRTERSLSLCGLTLFPVHLIFIVSACCCCCCCCGLYARRPTAPILCVRLCFVLSQGAVHFLRTRYIFVVERFCLCVTAH